MADERVQRRLAAIVAADVVGYSRLMGQDELGTLARLKSLRSELFDPKTGQYGGRIFKNTGDGALAEFGSAVDAVQCVVEIQRELSRRNAELPEDLRVVLRIGVSLGDVIVDGDDLYGNGVNVAARMESLAEPGAVCISGNVHEHIGNALQVAFEDLGEQTVKNIGWPVRAYRLLSQPTAGNPVIAQPDTPLPIPDKPSIAVLPFDNMSVDPEQEYFADGLVEDIITALSKVSGLMVIARNSTFVFKGAAVDIREVARKLGVRCVLEGSVRRSGNRLRVTVQLIEAAEGNHLWAERYDRVIEDVFDIQDEITKEVVTALRVTLTDGEAALVWHRGTQSIEAWRHCTEAITLFLRFNPRDLLRARQVSLKALEFDPDYAHAWAMNGICCCHLTRMGLGNIDDALLEEAERCAARAIALDDTVPWTHFLNSLLLLMQRQFDGAVAAIRTAVALNPGNAEVQASLAYTLAHAGDPQESVHAIRVAMRLNPHHPNWYRMVLGRALDVMGNHEQALAEFGAIIEEEPDLFGAHLLSASILARLGRRNEAALALEEAKKLNPKFGLNHIEDYLMTRDAAYAASVKTALETAGLSPA